MNVRALVALTYAFAPGMMAARRGGVINLASMAAFQPLAGATVYAASEAFVLLFSEGLALELEKSGVTGNGGLSRTGGNPVFRKDESQAEGRRNGPTRTSGEGNFARV